MTRTLSIVAAFVGLGMAWAGAGPGWLAFGFVALVIAYVAHAQPRESLAEDAEQLARQVAGRDGAPGSTCNGARRLRHHDTRRPWPFRLVALRGWSGGQGRRVADSRGDSPQ